MRRLATTTLLVSISRTALSSGAACLRPRLGGAESVPLFKPAAFHAREAFEGRATIRGPLPANWSGAPSGRLNDPDCADKSVPSRCQATAPQELRALAPRLGRTDARHGLYERNSRPFRYPTVCDRQYSWGTRRKITSCPTHTVDVTLSRSIWLRRRPANAAGPSSRAAGKIESAKQPCRALVVKRVPYSPDAKISGGEVKVKLPDGRDFAEIIAVQGRAGGRDGR